MKWTCCLFLLLLCFCCSGCVTTAAHTRQADVATARFARSTSDVLLNVYGSTPEYAQQVQQIERSAQTLEAIAEKDPGFRINPQAVSGIGAMIAMLTGPGCLAGAAFGLKKMMECNSLRSVARELTDLDPEDSKAHAIKHKVLI